MSKPRVDPVGPTKADYVGLVTSSNLNIRGAINHVVFLADRSVEEIVRLDRMAKLL